MPYKALILDYDDTLVQTRRTRYATLKLFAKQRYQFELSDTALAAAWGTPGLEFMEILFGQYEKDYSDMWVRYNALCTQHPNAAHAGAVDFLHSASGKFKLGILTSSSRQRVQPELADTGIAESLFIKIQTAEDTAEHKPDPAVFAPFLTLLENFSITAQETLYVGDALQDFKAASGAGIAFTGMAHNDEDGLRFGGLKIPFVRSFTELAQHLGLTPEAAQVRNR